MENKSKNIIIILLALVVVVLAVFIILNKNNKEKIVEEIKGEIILTDLEEKIKTEAPEWYKNWLGSDSGTNLSMFIKSGDENSITDTEYPYDFKENRSDLREKKSYYIYSPDKTKILDPNGQIFLGEEDGKIVEYLDVDSNVKLINLKTNKFKQVASCGTPCGFNDAFWVNNDLFVVLGQSIGKKGFDHCQIYEECMSPNLYIFDLKNNKYISYQGPEKLWVNENEEVSTTKDTYTYRNHGFTIELPKGFVPEEREYNSNYVISLPNNSNMLYITNASLWENNNLSNKYIKNEKIGINNFKVYDNGHVLNYYFRQGNVAYLLFSDSLDYKYINTFKFVGWN